ncbi:MAG: aminotransferase class V-fold PLP-dependent enzyme, partial [Thermodesulfobacteriota bacterium]
MISNHIYLDFNASTPLAPEVAEAMQPFLTQHFGNPSSLHWAGTPAKEAVENARRQVADLLSCHPHEIVFTSGGSESNNHAIKGVFFALREKGNHIVTTQIEHPAVLNPCRFLEKLGAEATYVGVDQYGRVDPDEVEKAITPKTILITVMHANNEVGTIQPIEEIA